MEFFGWRVLVGGQRWGRGGDGDGMRMLWVKSVKVIIGSEGYATKTRISFIVHITLHQQSTLLAL